MNTQNNIMIPRPIANDTATGRHVEEATASCTPIRGTLTCWRRYWPLHKSISLYRLLRLP